MQSGCMIGVATVCALTVGSVMLFAEEPRPERTVPMDRYPLLAHQARIAGDVQIRCLLDGEGAVIDAAPLSGHPILAKAASANARLWLFKRAELSGSSSEILLKYTFRLVSPGTDGTDVDTLKSNTRIDSSGTVIVTAPEACIDFVPCKARGESSRKK